MTPYRPPSDFLQWLEAPPDEWTRYVPVTGRWTGVYGLWYANSFVVGIPDEFGFLEGRWVYSHRKDLVDVQAVR